MQITDKNALGPWLHKSTLEQFLFVYLIFEKSRTNHTLLALASQAQYIPLISAIIYNIEMEYSIAGRERTYFSNK